MESLNKIKNMNNARLIEDYYYEDDAFSPVPNFDKESI